MSKVEFEIVEASGRSSISSKLLKGGEEWISEPYCRYPQTIVIRFPRPTPISKIEILVHRKYIPSRMDLYAATTQFSSIPPVHLFSLLGNIVFKEKKSDTGRHELKTIFVDTSPIFLKFSFGRNYSSVSNSKNQIGLVELNVFGGVESNEQIESSQFNNTASTISIYKPRGMAGSRRSNFSDTRTSLSTSSIWRISSRQSNGSSRSRTPSKQSQALNELKETLKRAEQAKIDAVEKENYALAKSARRAEIQLELILKQIRDVERAKEKAIDEDDFDRAQELTDQIKVLRDNAFEQVDIKFLTSIPNDPRPSSTQTTKTNMTSSTSASSIIRQYEDGRLKIDSTPPSNSKVTSAFQPIPLTPSTIVSVYPSSSHLSDELLPKTPSSLGSSTIISFHSDKNDGLSARKSIVSSQNLTPSPHPDPIPQKQPSPLNSPNSILLGGRAILPDSRLPNIRRLSDPTVYKSENVDKKNSTSASLASRISNIFNQKSNTENETPKNRFLEKENQVVPGAKRNKSAETVTLDSLLDNLHPSERSIAQQAIEFFGLKTVSRVYSKNWKDRRQGYVDIQKALKNDSFSRSKSKDLVRIIESLVVRGLGDKLFSVYSVVLDLLKQLLGTFVVQNGLVESDGPRIVNSTYQLLVNRTGDTVNERRFAEQTFEAISSLLHGDRSIANNYLLKFMQPFDSTQSVRTDQGKAKIVYDGLLELFSSRLTALSVKNVSQFALECLNHTDAKVRDYGRKLIIFLYEHEDRQQVRAALPKGNAAKKVPAIRNLLDDLDKLDSRLTLDVALTPNRQTRFDTNPTIINGVSAKKKRSKSSGAIRSPTRSRGSSQNVRLVSDKKPNKEDPVDYSKQPRPESDNAKNDSLLSIPALRSILKNK